LFFLSVFSEWNIQTAPKEPSNRNILNGHAHRHLVSIIINGLDFFEDLQGSVWEECTMFGSLIIIAGNNRPRG
jgi:hypothetical protein